MRRKGYGLGKGQGYKNMMPMDSHIHSLSAKGQKTYSHVKLNAKGKKYKKTQVEKDEDYAYNIADEFQLNPEWDSVGQLVRWYADGEISETTLRDRLYDLEQNLQEDYAEYVKMMKKAGKKVNAKGKKKKRKLSVEEEKMLEGTYRDLDIESKYFSGSDFDAKGDGDVVRFKDPKRGNLSGVIVSDEGDTYTITCGWGSKRYQVTGVPKSSILKAKGEPIVTIPTKDWKKMGLSKNKLLEKVALKFGYLPNVTKKEMDYIFQTNNIKGIESRFIEMMHKRPFTTNAKSTTSLVVRPAENVTYHKGMWQTVFDEKHPEPMENSEKQELMKESTMLKKKIKNLLYDAKSYKGEKAKDHELLTITVLKDKFRHFNFLTNHTDWNATGYFKDKILDVKFDKENNVIMQVEFLDTKNEKIGKELKKSFNRLNEIEIGESLLYMRTQPLEESSLPLEQWRKKQNG